MSVTSPTLDPDRPRVLPELWNHIIDALGPRRRHDPDDTEWRHMRALAACALVCHAWTHRARQHLYSTVLVRSGRTLRKLMNTLNTSPHLIPLVLRLVAAPPTGVSANALIVDYVPVVPFLNIHPTIAYIQLTNVIWYPHLYQWQYNLGFYNKSVTHLKLVGVAIPSLASILPFIHSFDNLAHLTFVGVYLERQATETELMVLEGLPSSYPAKSLHSLEVGGQGPGVIGVNLFGDNIDNIRLILHIHNPASTLLQHYHSCLSRYAHLISLSVTLEPWMSFKNPLAGSVDEGEMVWVPIRESFLDILRAVRSPAIRTIGIALSPQQQEPDGSESEDDTEPSPACRYRHTREGVMDTLFANDVRDFLLPAFPNLTAIDFIVRENRPNRNGNWWRDEIAARLELPPANIRVVIRDSYDEMYNDLWEAGVQDDQ